MPENARRRAGIAVIAIVLTGAAPPASALRDSDAGSIQPDSILGHIKVLSGDDFEGRGPGTAGEEKTIAYLTEQFRSMGLKPGNPDGTYAQKVPLVGFQATEVRGAFQVGARSVGLEF